MANPNTVPFVDAHHHLWDLTTGTYKWLTEPDDNGMLGNYRAICQDYPVSSLLEDFRGSHVVKSVHVEAGWSGDDPVQETLWLQHQSDRHGFPNGIVAHANLLAPRVEATLERHCQAPKMRGIRMLVQGPEIAQKDFWRGFAALGRFDLLFELAVTYEYMETALKLTAAFPATRVVIGHTGLPMVWTKSYFDQWRAALRKIAQAPNVAFKISGLGMFSHSWTLATIRPWIIEAIEIFGTKRCMFGTNWPVCRLYSSYRRLVRAYRAVISSFSRNEQEDLLCHNAERWFRLDH